MIYINNTGLGFIIARKLVSLGIRGSIFPFNGYFTEEELNSVEDLTVTSSDSLNGIEELRNLRSLSIFGKAQVDSEVENHYEDISKLKLLEELSIFDVPNIDELDLTGLDSLKKLIVVNNYNLCSISGLCDLKSLLEIVICGNNIRRLDDAISYIDNTADARRNIIDVLLFSETFPRDSKERRYLANRVYSNHSNIKFGEMLEFNRECYVLEFSDMLNMNAKSKAIISRLKMQDDDNLTKARKIHDYIVKNVSYDYNGIDIRNLIYNSGEDLSQYKNEYFRRRALVINSSFSAIMNNNSVCDGYVNAMRLLLNIEGIESRKVLCSAKSQCSTEPDHVIIKFRTSPNSEWLYADPEGEQRTGKNFFGLSYDEISESHVIFDYSNLKQGGNVYCYGKQQLDI